MGEFLHRPKGAQPAAEQPAPPQDETNDRRRPDHQRERIIEQHRQPAALRHPADHRKRRDDRQLPLTPEPDKADHGRQDCQPDGGETPLPRQPALPHQRGAQPQPELSVLRRMS